MRCAFIRKRLLLVCLQNAYLSDILWSICDLQACSSADIDDKWTDASGIRRQQAHFLRREPAASSS